MTVAVKVEGPYETHDFTVPNSVGIAQFTLCMISGSRTAAASGDQKYLGFAGIAGTEKVAADGSTELGLWTTGTFDIVNATKLAIPAGSFVALSGSNTVGQAVATDWLSGSIVGKTMEELASEAAGEVKLISV